MSVIAPLFVPVELRRDGRSRWFRLASGVGADRLALAHVAPAELEGPVGIAFHLPGDAAPIHCRGRVVEEVVGVGAEEHAERCAIALFDVDENARARIEHYVTERLGLSS